MEASIAGDLAVGDLNSGASQEYPTEETRYSERKWNEDTISYASSSSSPDHRQHHHHRGYYGEDDVSEETTSTASTRLFSPNQPQRKYYAETSESKVHPSNKESQETPISGFNHLRLVDEEEDNEEESVPQLHSPSSSRALLEKLLLEDDAEEDDPTKFLLLQSMNWHQQVKQMGKNSDKYADLDDIHSPQNHDVQPSDCNTCLSSETAHRNTVPDPIEDLPSSSNHNDPFDTQSSYISSEDDDSLGDDEEQTRKELSWASNTKQNNTENNTISTHSLPVPPPPPPPLPRRLGLSPTTIKTQSYALAQFSTQQVTVKESSNPEMNHQLQTEPHLNTEEKQPVETFNDVELCLSLSQGEEGCRIINENDTSILILPSGRPVLSQPPSTPITILNPDPLEFTVASLKHPRDESITEPHADLNLKDVEKDTLRRSFHQSIPASVLVNLSHKRYERRRLAAMEIEKVVRNLVVPNISTLGEDQMDRARAILLMLSEDYIKSTNEDARKGGVVALAACAIAFKKGQEKDPFVMESKDLILASVIFACQDNSSRVRYYATESLFNVIKVLPVLAVHHFIILLEILRSLCADVDTDVRSGAELLDKKLKEIVIAAITSGSLTPDACVPIFARFAHIRHKPTKKLTLSWLQEFTNKLIGAPLLQFIHLFLVDIFAILADPNLSMRQLAFQFLNTNLSKMLMTNEDFEDSGNVSIDFDKIMQSLVTTMEHPDPLVRKVAMYWIARIVTTFLSPLQTESKETYRPSSNTSTVAVRNTLPHVLPGILLSIGDTFQIRPSSKDAFLPDNTTHALAEQTNQCLRDTIVSDGALYIPLLPGFVIALREELETPGGLSGKNPPAVERKPNRLDVKSDGTGIESTGWFRSSDSEMRKPQINEMSCTCALSWISLLYDYVVPDSLKREFADEFISPVIKLIEIVPQAITFKCLEVLSKITISMSSLDSKDMYPEEKWDIKDISMTEAMASFALGVLQPDQLLLQSRDRKVFQAIIRLHAQHPNLMPGLHGILCHMCTLQPAEFIFISFGMELDHFVQQKLASYTRNSDDTKNTHSSNDRLARDLDFVSHFVQELIHVFLTSSEAGNIRHILKDCMAFEILSQRDQRRVSLFSILLKTFGHNFVASLSFCLWSGAFQTASLLLRNIDPLEVNLSFYLELDQLVEYLERPLFRHLHLLMLQQDQGRSREGSSTMLYRVLKSILMVLPQSTSYMILKDRLISVSRFYLSMRTLRNSTESNTNRSEAFFVHLTEIRKLHCEVKWRTIRAGSLDPFESMDSSYQDVTEVTE